MGTPGSAPFQNARLYRSRGSVQKVVIRIDLARLYRISSPSLQEVFSCDPALVLLPSIATIWCFYMSNHNKGVGMQEGTKDARPAWTTRLKNYEGAENRRALIQLADTTLPYLAIFFTMLILARAQAPLWLILFLALPGGAFLMRSFIIFHDCCHGSYLSSRKANDLLGRALGLLVFTPFAEWRRSHGNHHVTAGNLDRRGVGDIWTMTVSEYEGSSALLRLRYRLYRNPLVLFVLGPFFIFVVMNRMPTRGSRAAQTRDLLIHDLALASTGALLGLTFGLLPWLLVQGSILLFGGMAGIWMFYVQHQFDPSYWRHGEGWSFFDAAMEGSSWYRLPAPLQWITGNIGLHHIHHLAPRIPNYRLQSCLEAIPELRLKNHLEFGRSLRAVSLNLWDEVAGTLIPFRALRGRAIG